MATIVPEPPDDSPALFDDAPLRVEPQEPTDPSLSPDRRRTIRQARWIEAGLHPLIMGAGLGSRSAQLHPNAAPEMCSPDAPKGQPYTCGSCRFRQVVQWRPRTYPKCIVDVVLRGASSLDVSPIASHGSATDVRAWWPACKDYEPGDTALSPDAARCMGGAE